MGASEAAGKIFSRTSIGAFSWESCLSISLQVCGQPDACASGWWCATATSLEMWGRIASMRP
eukprot:6642111-Pyramimonas_sp.AAC.1